MEELKHVGYHEEKGRIFEDKNGDLFYYGLFFGMMMPLKNDKGVIYE